MSETRKTALFVAAALVLAALAYLAVPAREAPELFSDEGEPFYEPFDPVEIASVTVASFPEDKATPQVFKVELRGGRWTIPSHEGYPADADDQLAQTAAVVNGLVKGPIRSDRARDFAEYGVVDPLSEARASSAGRGRRVTLHDATGRLLSDLVIGYPLEGRPEMRYVRRPDSNRTYACRIEAGNISTRFADWVDTDLLRLRARDIRNLTLDRYRVDEREGVMRTGDVIRLERDGGAWVLPDIEEGHALDEDKIKPMTDALADMTLVGVRRKPDGLLELLEHIEGGGRISQSDLFKIRDLTSVGFHLIQTDDGRGYRVVSTEGELRVKTDRGVAYTLRFGDILYGDPDVISAAGGEAADEGDSDDPEGAEHRYLFVTAAFDESLLGPKPEPPAKPEPPEEGDGESADGAEADQEDSYEDLLAEYEKARERYERGLSAHERRVQEGRRKAAELQERFEDWYYVISADVFEKLNLSRGDLLVAEEDPDGEESAEEAEADGPEDDPLDLPADAEADE